MIYITGGTGRLGAEVVKLFPRAKLVHRGDPLDFHDATAVIHLAGSLNFNHPREMWESNVEFTRRVVAATPPQARLVFASSISVYGKKLAELPAGERTTCHPDSPYAKSKYEAEKLVRQHPNSVALRIGAIYGPGPKFKEFFSFLRRIEKGRIFIIGNGKNRIPFVHVQDAARAVKAAVRAPSGVYLVVGEAVQQKQAYAMTAELLGAPVPRLHVPLWVAQAFIALGLLVNEHVSILYHDRVFDCSRAWKYLGFKPRPLKQGMREMVRAYRSQN